MNKLGRTEQRARTWSGRTVFLMNLVHYLGAVTTLADPAQPNIRELGKERTRIFANLVWVDEIRNNVNQDKYYWQGDCDRFPVDILVQNRKDTKHGDEQEVGVSRPGLLYKHTT